MWFFFSFFLYPIFGQSWQVTCSLFFKDINEQLTFWMCSKRLNNAPLEEVPKDWVMQHWLTKLLQKHSICLTLWTMSLIGAKSYTGHHPEHWNLTVIKSSYQNQPNVVLTCHVNINHIQKPKSSSVDNLVAPRTTEIPRSWMKKHFLNRIKTVK